MPICVGGLVVFHWSPVRFQCTDLLACCVKFAFEGIVFHWFQSRFGAFEISRIRAFFFLSIVFRWSLERFQCSDFIGIDDCNQFSSSSGFGAVSVQFQRFDLSVLKRFNEFFIVGNPNCVALFNRFPLVISVRFRHGFGTVSVRFRCRCLSSTLTCCCVFICYLLLIQALRFCLYRFPLGPAERFQCGFIADLLDCLIWYDTFSAIIWTIFLATVLWFIPFIKNSNFAALTELPLIVCHWSPQSSFSTIPMQTESLSPRCSSPMSGFPR